MKPLVILAGPTAVGKTALSIKLADKNFIFFFYLNIFYFLLGQQLWLKPFYK